MFEIRCVSIRDHDWLQNTVGPADVAAAALRVCPMASGFGFADHVIMMMATSQLASAGLGYISPPLSHR